jgi:class 3 adenylate cyclase/predicted ATPase
MSTQPAHIHFLERRLLTVMFIDMVESSVLLRKLEIEEAEKLFREVISCLIKACEEHSGTVNQVMGDGIMCLFGAEPPFEDHAFKAIAAAEQMLEDIKSLRKTLRQRRLRIRIGINTGEVILQRASESSYRSRYLVLGETVHIADRALKLAAPDTALIAESSQKQVERYFQLTKSVQLHWNSKQDPIQLYVRADVSGGSPAENGKKAVRAEAIEEVAQYLTAVPENTGLRIIHLHGEAGYGKTFFVHRVVKQTRLRYFKSVLSLNFYPHPVPGKSLLEAVILEKILPKARDEWRGIIHGIPSLRLIGDEDFLLDCVHDALGMSVSKSRAYQSLDNASRARVRRLITYELLRQHGAKNETLIVLEDLHWATTEELKDVEGLLSGCASGTGLHVLCTSRSVTEFSNGLKERVKAFELRPLSPIQSLSLLEEVSGRSMMPAALSKAICDLSAGNPYFVREYGLWIKSELKKGVPGRHLLKKVQNHAPQEIVSVVYAKLSNLDKETIDLARTAAVQGMTISPEMLGALAGIEAERALNALQKLEGAGILSQGVSQDTAVYTFSHELLQRVVYNSITKSNRLVLHRRALNYLRGTARAPGSRRLMAYHAERTKDPVLQYIHSKRAAQAAKKMSRHTEALEFLKSAERALKRLGHKKAIEPHFARLRFEAIESLFITGRYALVKKALDYALARNKLLRRPAMLLETLSYRGLYYWIRGEIPKAEKAYLAILKASRSNADRETLLRESARLAHVCIDLGKYRSAARHAEDVLQHLEQTDPRAKCGLLTEIGPTLYSCLALAHAHADESQSSRQHISKAQELLADSQDYFTRIYVSSFIGSSLLMLGDYEAARRSLEISLKCCSVVQSPLLKPYALSAYGLTLAKMGEPEEGRKHCEEALAVAHRSGLALRRSLFHIRLAQAEMLCHKYALAMKHLRRAIKFAVASGEKHRVDEAQALMQECYRLLPETDSQRRRHLKYFSDKTAHCEDRCGAEKSSKILSANEFSRPPKARKS